MPRTAKRRTRREDEADATALGILLGEAFGAGLILEELDIKDVEEEWAAEVDLPAKELKELRLRMRDDPKLRQAAMTALEIGVRAAWRELFDKLLGRKKPAVRRRK